MSSSVAPFALYVTVLAALSLNGVHRLWLLLAWWRARAAPAPQAEPPASWPSVTVQVPVFDERNVVRRVVSACGELDYPRDRLQVQILDDSTDDTTAIAAAAVAELVATGVDAVLCHRADRAGFKAGALDAGLRTARGELLAIFDADFLPPRDFLRRTVPHLRGRVGAVQARWGHLNAGDSWLTAAQATLLDGHFVIEQAARHASGRWFNFNGTAGIWRRECLVAAGGWQHDTLTEDLDLSYRAQLAGWELRYLTDLVARAELPADMASFKSQQHRWAKGSIQTARKLLRRIWVSPAPLATKVEATVHLCSNLSYPLIVLLTLLLPWTLWLRIEGEAPGLVALDRVLFPVAVLPFVAFYAAAIVGSGAPGAARRIRALPVALGLGLGLALAQTRAVVEGLAAPVGSFVRTPKRGSAGGATYPTPRSGLLALELAMGAYVSIACVGAAAAGYVASLPFLALLAFGYGAVVIGSARA